MQATFKKKSNDKILIQNLQVNAYIGIYDFEQENLQPLIFNLKLTSKTNFALVKNNLALSVDYAQVCDLIKNFVDSKKHLLLETLAEEVAQILLKEFSISKLKLNILKPKALQNALAGVEITRWQND